MSFGFLNLGMMIGLLALAIPIIIHLLNRRRFEVVDWGAMRFLQISETTRRRVFIEEVLLMVLRMGLIALLVLGMCAPFASSASLFYLGIGLGMLAVVLCVLFVLLGLLVSGFDAKPPLITLVVPLALVATLLLLVSYTAVENRDIVLVFDGSTAMSYTDDDGVTAQQHAVKWAQDLVDKLTPGDTVAIIQAREQPVEYPAQAPDPSKPWDLKQLPLPVPTADLNAVRETLNKLADPAGDCQWPAAVQMASAALRKYSTRSRRDVILLGVGRSSEWSDPKTLDAWTLTARQLADGAKTPRLWRVSFADDRPKEVPNWSMTPVRAEGVGFMTDVTFRTSLRIEGQKYERPYRLRYEIDLPPGEKRALKDVDRLGKDIKMPETDDLKNGRVPVTFAARLPGPGAHLISVRVEPDAPKKEPGAKTTPRDRLAGDNLRHYAVMVPLLPVLIVDPREGEKRPVSDAIWAALGGARQSDPSAGLLTQTRVIDKLEDLKEILKSETGPEANHPLRVAVLCDVKELAESQRIALEEFVRDGGSLLVIVGPRADRNHYNKFLYSKVVKETVKEGDKEVTREVVQEGEGWLPARLEKQIGDDSRQKAGAEDRAAHPDEESFTLPALNLFHDPDTRNDIEAARFRRWWQIIPAPSGRASVKAKLKVIYPKETAYPWLVEKEFGKGRVLLCATPLYDPTSSVPPQDEGLWRTNIHTLEVPGYTPLVYHLVSYLAGHHVAGLSFEPGKALHYLLPADERGMARKSVLKTPRGNQVELTEKNGVVQYEDTRLPGVYVLTTPRLHTVYFTVQPAPPTGLELAPWTEEDREKVSVRFAKQGLEAADPSKAAGVPLTYTADVPTILKGPDRDLWWLMLAGVTALLCGEVWMTRRIAKGR